MLSSLAIKSGTTLLLITAIMVSLAVVARNWSCQQSRWEWRKEQRQPKTVEYHVVSVPNGAAIVASRREGRERRTVSIYLSHIRAPLEGEPYFAESRDNLALLAGDRIRVEQRRILRLPVQQGRSRDEGQEAESRPDDAEGVAAPDAPEQRNVIVGNVWGRGGALLNAAQLRDGWALSVGDVPEEWRQAENEARKNKRGMWR